MKSRKVILFSILIIGLLVLSAKAGFCTDAVQTATAALPADIHFKTDSAKSVLIKFAFTMGGVFVSLVIIWLGLIVFKKMTGNSTNAKKNIYNDELLNSPKTTDEAILFFINKNRLK